jgi:hypothetical protein
VASGCLLRNGHERAADSRSRSQLVGLRMARCMAIIWNQCSAVVRLGRETQRLEHRRSNPCEPNCIEVARERPAQRTAGRGDGRTRSMSFNTPSDSRSANPKFFHGGSSRLSSELRRAGRAIGASNEVRRTYVSSYRPLVRKLL